MRPWPEPTGAGGGRRGPVCRCCSFPCRPRGGRFGLEAMIRRGGSRSRRRGSCGGRGCRRGWWPYCGSGGGWPTSPGLNSRQRLDNLAGALTVVPGGGRLLAEGLVVLVDDLMTTGASLTEAARAVREARARENTGNHGEQMRAGHRDQRQRWAGGRRQRVQQRGGREVAGCDGEGAGVVYTAPTRESMGERLVTVTEEDTDRERCSVTAAGVGGVRDVICAAVVAAPPDSFEINRN